MQVSIYALSHPDRPQDVRYVGQTKRSLSHRLRAHISWATSRKSRGLSLNHRASWILSVLRENKTPAITLLQLTEQALADEAECSWIKRYLDEGRDLVNGTAGGGGYDRNHSKRPVTTQKGVAKSQDHKKKISTSLRKEVCRKGHNLDGSNLRIDIRGGRHCKQCAADYQRARDERLKKEAPPQTVVAPERCANGHLRAENWTSGETHGWCRACKKERSSKSRSEERALRVRKQWPDEDEVLRIVALTSVSELARMVGVSYNAAKKHCAKIEQARSVS
jgi:hypothetical protein